MTSSTYIPRSVKKIGQILLLILVSLTASFADSELTTVNKNTSDCVASFEVLLSDVDSAPEVVTLYNQSTGEYTNINWDFGDGTTCSNSGNTVTHAYAEEGNYTITLTIWNTDGTCESSFSKEVNFNVSTASTGCSLIDCVWPGDANKDGKADAYDIIHMGMGFGMTGPPRIGDPEEWYGHYAPNWDFQTPDGINYKHLDTNGDGIIDEYDMIPVIHHYTPMENNYNYSDPDAPRIYLDFDVDTFEINQYSGEYAYISAALNIGTADNPLEDLMGLSLYLEYDTSLVDLSSGIILDYNSNCFYGEQDEVLSYGRSIAATRQIDIGMARKTLSGSTGYGRVASIDFDIIIDIIDGRAEQEVKFPVKIKGVKAVDSNGDIINLNVDQEDATVVFIDKIETSAKENLINRRVTVYPNPVKGDFITIALEDLSGSEIQFYNTLGQLVKSELLIGKQTNVFVADLPLGVYELVITTDEGVANKRLIVD